MDFFQQQARVRGQSQRMVLLFVLAVAAIVAAVDLVAVIAIRSGSGGEGTPPIPAAPVAIGTSIIVLAIISLASLYRIVRLASGGAAVARSLGAVFISPDTASPQHRRLRNVVEEIAIASGVPVPQLFVLEQEPGINAFAAGFSPSDAAVTVTRGALEKLSRDELQGVIAHEFSHLLNGDMRLNIRMMGLLFGILAIATIGREILSFSPRSDSEKGGAGILVVGIAIMAFGYIGVFFGRMIKASVSRNREYLADASAVQFTRQTQGLAGALKKAAGLDAGTRFQSVHGEEVAHMLFGDGIGLSGLFATHPPLVQRIRVLEPQFDASQLGQQAAEWNDPNYVVDEAQPVMSNLVASGSTAVMPARVSAQVAQPDQDDYRTAMALHRALPDDWLAAARDEVRAGDVVMALAVDDAPEVRARQLAGIEGGFGAARRAGVEALLASLNELHPVQRLPLAAVALPALRRRTRDELMRFMHALWALVRAHGQVQVFEYCLARLVRDQIADVLAPVFGGTVGRRSLADCKPALVTLLSVLAEQGNDDPEQARRAFAAGAALVLPGPAGLAHQPPGEWAQSLDAALKELDQLEPAGKQRLVQGMVEVLSNDGRITLVEAELLRAVCGALHCPLPPLLQAGLKSTRMPITDWPESERPREKLLARGANALSDAELLAIFLRTGVAGKTAVDLARELLVEFGGLRQLLRANRKDFCAAKGLGDAKFTQLQAVLEMARRHFEQDLHERDALADPAATRRFLTTQLRDLDHEAFAAIFLDSQHQVIAFEVLARGSIDSASVYPREVVKRALAVGAAALIFAHNHPSGRPEPSAADRALTDRLKLALGTVDIRVLDHLVIGEGAPASFAERGWL